MEKLEIRVDGSSGEVQQVVDDEGENDGAAPVHGAGGVRGDDGSVADVGDGAGGVIELGKLDGAENVGQNAEQDHGSRSPEEGDVVMKGFSVGVEGVPALGTGRKVNLEIAQHMAEHEGNQDNAR